MPLEIVRNDITKMQTDVIVSAANHSLTGGGGVNGQIHRAAGERFCEECRALGGCKEGQAKITKGGDLPAKYVIHTVGPVWQGGGCAEEEILRSCYRESLQLAKKHKCKSIAFPLISTGAFGYPKDKALRTAVSEITEFLFENDMMIYIVVFSKEAVQISEKLFSDIEQYIDDNYAKQEEYLDERFRRREESDTIYAQKGFLCESKELCMPCASAYSSSLEDFVENVDESFQRMLLRKIDESGMKDSECYKRANVDRKLFSKIRKNVNYKPSKSTAIAFAIALRLDLSQTEDLLKKAGYALSHSNKFDLIIEYFIGKGIYDVFAINEALFAFDQSLLGA